MARGINILGQVVGYADTAEGLQRAFLYSGGQMINLGIIGDRWCSSIAYGINDNGQIVGETFTPEEDRRAFLYKNGVMADLGTLGGNTSVATAINDRGQVAGLAPVLGRWTSSSSTKMAK